MLQWSIFFNASFLEFSMYVRVLAEMFGRYIRPAHMLTTSVRAL